MSSAISNAAALRRPFIFDADTDPEVGPQAHVRTASADCPVERNSTVPIPAHLQSGFSRRNSEGRLSPHELQSTINNQRISPASVTTASQLEIRPAPEMVSSGIPALDTLTGGLPRGCLTEICGPASSGRTTVLLAALAAATRRGEFCALIDASDALDPLSLSASGVDLDRLLWVRCGDSKKDSPQRRRDTEKNEKGENGCRSSTAPFASEACLEFVERVGISRPSAVNYDETKFRASQPRIEQVLRATDLLLESGGFGLIVLDIGDLPPQAARRIPLTTWFRFRRAIEYKPTILLAIEQQPIAGSCSSVLLQLGVSSTQYSVPSSDHKQSKPSHSQLLSKVEIRAELVRSRLERKPARSITFESKTAWAG